MVYFLWIFVSKLVHCRVVSFWFFVCSGRKIFHLLRKHTEGGDDEWGFFFWVMVRLSRIHRWHVYSLFFKELSIICKLHHFLPFQGLHTWGINWIIYIVRGGFVFSFDNIPIVKRIVCDKRKCCKNSMRLFLVCFYGLSVFFFFSFWSNLF